LLDFTADSAECTLSCHELYLPLSVTADTSFFFQHTQRWWQMADEDRSDVLMARWWLGAGGHSLYERTSAMSYQSTSARSCGRLDKAHHRTEGYHVRIQTTYGTSGHIYVHHKLSDWNMVIHGGVDNYSHSITSGCQRCCDRATSPTTRPCLAIEYNRQLSLSVSPDRL
jgi:hypothetical protein